MILDYLCDLRLSPEEVDEHFDSTMALARLAEGLFWIYREVERVEQRARRKAAKDNTLIDVAGGCVDGASKGVLSCAFQWYAVSACNYAQLVGWLATRNTAEAKNRGSAGVCRPNKGAVGSQQRARRRVLVCHEQSPRSNQTRLRPAK